MSTIDAELFSWRKDYILSQIDILKTHGVTISTFAKNYGTGRPRARRFRKDHCCVCMNSVWARELQKKHGLSLRHVTPVAKFEMRYILPGNIYPRCHSVCGGYDCTIETINRMKTVIGVTD